MAGLLEAPSRGVFKISAKGKEILNTTRDPINLRLLQKLPGYLEARGRKKERFILNGVRNNNEEHRTPEEMMELSYQTLWDNLDREMLTKLKSVSPAFF